METLFPVFINQTSNISLSSLPRPQEWIFATGDNVIVYPSNNKGIISAINTNFAEVEIPEEGIHCVPWQNVKKYFKIGPYHNMNGWVMKGLRYLAGKH